MERGSIPEPDFREVCQNLYDGIHITDGEGVILFINDAYTRTTGIRPEQVLGRRVSEIEGLLYQGSVTGQVLKTKQRVNAVATILELGKEVLVTGTPVFDSAGNVKLVVTNTRDFPELKRLEQQLHALTEEQRRANQELAYLRRRQAGGKELIYRSEAMESVMELARTVAQTDVTVLITGESGTGKELIANELYQNSARRDKPFIKVNCAAIPAELLESELFGYEEGAFTGAQKKGKIGLFEIANHGTIFLDEIGDAPFDVQILLLRVLEERVISRVGGIHQIPVDLRIIAATNRPLQDMVRNGTFRTDLYYRLNVLSIHTQPVRTMPGEIVPFLQQYIHRLSGSVKEFSPQAVQLLQEYTWPGNFRELRNVAEYLHCISPGTKAIAAEQLPQYLLEDLNSVPCAGEEPALPDPLSLHILRLLQSARPKCVGRGYLVAALEQDGVAATEREVKQRLIQLQEQGLVRIGSTRQGTAISSDGIELLALYSD